MKLILLALLSLSSVAHADYCGLLQSYPHRSTATLSSGVRVDLPMHVNTLANYVVFGTVDPTVAAGQIPAGRKPYILNGYGLGALAVFDYEESDLGAFREAYFMILLENPEKPERPALYYAKAWSSSPTTVLASLELWGIPAKPAEITYQDRGFGTLFQVRNGAQGIFDMDWAYLPVVPSPLDFLLSIDAVGSNRGRTVSFPIETCGASLGAPFGFGDSIQVYDRALDVQLKALAFSPMTKEFSYREAVIFPAR